MFNHVSNILWSLRIISELFREPDVQIGYLFNLFSMGTILSFLMIISGLIILNTKKKMKSNFKFFKNSKSLPVDKFFQNVLYDKNLDITTQGPVWSKGDFVTAPSISNLFSEMIAVWIISTWKF